MHFNRRYSYYHRLDALAEFGLYNWKQHSTGYLLKELRRMARYCYYDDIYANDSASKTNPSLYNKGFTNEYWRREWCDKIREELAKRPHLSNKKERKAREKSS